MKRMHLFESEKCLVWLDVRSFVILCVIVYLCGYALLRYCYANACLKLGIIKCLCKFLNSLWFFIFLCWLYYEKWVLKLYNKKIYTTCQMKSKQLNLFKD